MQEILSFIYFNIVPFVLILSVLVFVHELGHYLVARYNNVRIEVFSIGFGPEIFGWTDRQGTRWKVSYIPLGGYVKMFSDLNAASQPDVATIAQMSEADKAVSLFHKSVFQRIAISAAGPLANYLFAIVLLSGLYTTVGQRVPSSVAKVGHVIDNTAAARAGLQPDDQIIAINDQPIQLFSEMQEIVKKNASQKLTLHIIRHNQNQQVEAIPDAKETAEGRIGILGITQGVDTRILPFYQACWHAILDVIQITGTTLSSFGRMLTGKQSANELSGPLGIASLASQAAQVGFIEVLWLAALLSISLGLINLFPIPMLDGGHLLFYFIEAIRGKPVSERVQELGYKIGFAIVIGLILFSTWNDVSRQKIFTKIFDALKHFLG